MSLRSPVATLFAVALLQAGCTSDGGVQCFGIMKNNVCYPYGSFEDTTGGCTSDQECLPTGVCLEGACGQQCTSDAQCLNGYECRTYRCEPRGRGPEDVTTPGDTSDAVPCRNHLDCEPLDLACINGFCAAECKEDWH
ncbi:MAG: hypothetical protein FJ098_11785, partial [Deltaproteobacteria bacterium]|nr:hypothetical protein [Deltaproteobacteria bacterium]